MFNLQKYRKYLVLGCLTMAFTLTPIIVRASVSSPSEARMQVAQNLSIYDVINKQRTVKLGNLDYPTDPQTHGSLFISDNPLKNSDSEEAQIKKALLIDAQKQNWHPKIGIITIVDEFAIATTSDENTGGESVLKKQLGAWKVIGGTGGAFSKPEELVQIAKVPLPTARRLLSVRARQQR